jgi:hypothetical protein
MYRCFTELSLKILPTCHDLGFNDIFRLGCHVEVLSAVYPKGDSAIMSFDRLYFLPVHEETGR